MKINHISVSRTETYNQCAAKYRYRYHLGIIPETTPFYFTFGKIAHKIIEEYTAGRGEISIKTITDQVLGGEMEIEPGVKAPVLKPWEFNRLNLHLNNFLKLCKQIGTDGETEWPFNIDLDKAVQPAGAPETPATDPGRHWVGFIDRLIIKNNQYFIIDYKTTKPSKFRKDKTTIRKDLQIKGYCYIVRNHFKVKGEQVRAALYYLEDAKFVDSGHFDDATLDRVPEELLAVYKKIEQHDSNKVVGTTGDHCWLCDYKDICPFYKEWKSGSRVGGGRSI